MEFRIKGKIDPSTVQVKEFIPVSALLRVCVAITEDGRRLPAILDGHRLVALIDPSSPMVRVDVADGKGWLTKP